MDDTYFGSCDHCSTKIASHHYALSRHVEQCVFPSPDVSSSQTAKVSVLYAEELARYCGHDCAGVGAYVQMQDRGIELDEVAPGPMAPCSKCGQLMSLSEAHVAYEMIDQTEVHQPWLIVAEPESAKIIARVCQNCDSDLQVASLEWHEGNLVERVDELKMLLIERV